MAAAKSALWKRFLILPPIALGILLVFLMQQDRAAPEHGEIEELIRPVRVVTLEEMAYVPRALGYGQVQPGTVWNAVAQVAGKVVERHPDLEPGKLIEAGTLVLRIDPVDYELAVVRFEAQIASVEAELAELAVREANIRAALQIERSSMVLAEAELERKKTLRDRGNASQATVDEAERTVLSQRQRVQEQENQLNLIPVQRQVLEASLALNRAQLEDARLDLERTEIQTPFDARVAEANVEEKQFVNVGEVLAVADSIDVAEVQAEVPIEQMQSLVSSTAALAELPVAEMGRLAERLFGGAIVRLRTGPVAAAWTGRVDRVSPAIDPQTRTVGVIVAVDEPYRQSIPGTRPPLVKNMYVQVELFGHSKPDSLVVPRTAIHHGSGTDKTVVYVVDDDDRLAIIPVVTGPSQGDAVVIRSGVEPGARIVVSDLMPASVGMKLTPTEDSGLAQALRRDAGRSSVTPDTDGRRAAAAP